MIGYNENSLFTNAFGRTDLFVINGFNCIFIITRMTKWNNNKKIIITLREGTGSKTLKNLIVLCEMRSRHKPNFQIKVLLINICQSIFNIILKVFSLICPKALFLQLFIYG